MGDLTLRLNYDLSTESTVFDIGGYRGQWTSDIVAMYCCKVHVFEPIADLSRFIRKRFQNNPNITVHPVGAYTKNCLMPITLDNDGSSLYLPPVKTETIELVDLSAYIKAISIKYIDLIKINIEGAEYDLLDHLINTNMIGILGNIQVQFHRFIPDADKRLEKIRHDLSKTHSLTFQYNYIWENWKLNSVNHGS
jgi:FkbM family methyltransferase